MKVYQEVVTGVNSKVLPTATFNFEYVINMLQEFSRGNNTLIVSDDGKLLRGIQKFPRNKICFEIRLY